MRRLASKATETGSRVEIDMESSIYTDRTLDIATRVAAECACVRCVIQAYLLRSEADLRRLNDRRVSVRLCKGAYDEPPAVAFPSKADVDRNYVSLMKMLFDHGTYPAIATHDEQIIDEALRYTRGRGIGPDRSSFKCCMVRRDLRRRLIGLGHHVRLYVLRHGVVSVLYARLPKRPPTRCSSPAACFAERNEPGRAPFCVSLPHGRT